MNILSEAADIIRNEADSIEDGYRLNGNLVGMPDEVAREIGHYRDVARLLMHASATLGIAQE